MKTPSKEPPGENDVAPEGCVETRRIVPQAEAIGAAHILVMHIELVEVGKSSHPTDAEDAGRSRSHLIDKRDEVAFGQLGGAPGCKPLPRPRKDETRCSERVMLPQHEMRSEVASRPRCEQRRRIRTELDEEIAQLLTLECVEQRLRHGAGL